MPQKGEECRLPNVICSLEVVHTGRTHGGHPAVGYGMPTHLLHHVHQYLYNKRGKVFQSPWYNQQDPWLGLDSHLKPGLDGPWCQALFVIWAPSLRQLFCIYNQDPNPLLCLSGLKAVSFVPLPRGGWIRRLKEGQCLSGQELIDTVRTTLGPGLRSIEGFCGIPQFLGLFANTSGGT